MYRPKSAITQHLDIQHLIYIYGNYVQSYSLILVEIFCYNIKFLYRYVIKKVGRFKSKTIINIFFCI